MPGTKKSRPFFDQPASQVIRGVEPGVNPDFYQPMYEWQQDWLERQTKHIAEFGKPNNAAEANIAFRLENAGDAFREIASKNGARNYILEKLAKIENSLVDSEWRLPLSKRALNALDQIKSSIQQAPVVTKRHKAAQRLMLAVADRNIPAIRREIREIRFLSERTYGDYISERTPEMHQSITPEIKQRLNVLISVLPTDSKPYIKRIMINPTLKAGGKFIESERILQLHPRFTDEDFYHEIGHAIGLNEKDAEDFARRIGTESRKARGQTW